MTEGLTLESQGLTKPCADEEPGDTLGVIVLLALEDLTGHGFLMQLRRQGREEGCQRLGPIRASEAETASLTLFPAPTAGG